MIKTHNELLAAIREAYVGAATMEPKAIDIARDLQWNTFGGELRARGGKMPLNSLEMAVGLFLEQEIGEEADEYDDAFYARCNAQRYLDALQDLAKVKFTSADVELLRPLDRQHFYRLFMDILGGSPTRLLNEFSREANALAEEEGWEKDEDDD